MEHKVINTNKPTNSIIFLETTGCTLYTSGDDFYVSGDITAEQAQAFYDAHNPPDPAVAAKVRTDAKAALLAKLGITAEEATLLLS